MVQACITLKVRLELARHNLVAKVHRPIEMLKPGELGEFWDEAPFYDTFQLSTTGNVIPHDGYLAYIDKTSIRFETYHQNTLMPAPRTKEMEMGPDLVEFAIDTSQDLLVCI